MVNLPKRSRSGPAGFVRSAIQWSAILAMLSLGGCLGDFLSQQEIDQKLDAYAASLDVSGLEDADANQGDTTSTDTQTTDSATDAQDAATDSSDAGCHQDVDCDDQDPCTVDSCHKDGACSHKPGNDGASCSDGNQCTLDDKCVQGECHGGELKDCNDKNVCTYDACQIATGCTHTQDYGTECDDGDDCTLYDACVAGKCAGTPKDCGADDCTTAKCLNGKCNSASKLDGTKCSDGDACTIGDTCKGGLCLPTAQTVCDDKNACTADSCEPSTGCTHELLTEPCSDGNGCTVGDQCEGGTCKGGVAKLCDDGSDCTGDVCNPVSGACDTTPITATCNDGDPCTQGDACVGGKCKAGAATQCDDGNPCTEDACSPDSGACNHIASSGPCDDGNGCSVGDTCSGGKCTGSGEKPCVDADTCTSDSCDASTGNCVHTAIAGCGDTCSVAADCKTLDVCSEPACLSGKCAYLPTTQACDDQDPCTQGDVCQNGACKAGSPVNCDDGNPCTDDLCAAGKCSNVANSGPCSDGDACTTGDTCAGSKCTSGKAKSCDDGNPCTSDGCDAQSGNCSSDPNAADCNDKNPCTLGDVCKGGSCSPGAAKNCDDGNSCTADACDASGGNCTASNTTAPCDDGNACSAGDTCQGGQCASGTAKNCDDGNPCTNDACDPQSGDCSNSANAAPCSDGNACTVGDACQASACKPGAAAVCADTDTCTNDSCDPQSGNCVFKPITGCGGNCAKASDCSDNNPCTDDACTAGKCAFPPNTAACSDGNACTSGDTCGNGSCKPGSAKNCDDGNPCTDDSCDSKTGLCAATPNSANCDDANACTQGDVCGGGACKPGLPVNCSDGKVCTDDSCDTKTGTCKNSPNTVSCDDGNACTVGDGCVGGACIAGEPANCDDNNACTNDSCNPATGACGHVNNTSSCSDGNACTLSDLCAAGVCKPGSAKLCSDGKVCTDDSCDPASGACQYTANTAACDDGNACTTGDKCAASACVAGTSKTCNDNDNCTSDSCDGGSGTCVFAPIVGCGGNCTKNLDCSDGNTCTDNICSSGKCTFPINTKDCNDNNACTTGDICAGGKCTPGAAKSCDDNNPCTNDSCDTQTGTCGYVNNTGSCTDNDACTKVDTCSGGKCVASQPVVCNDSNPCTDDSCNPASGTCTFANNTATCTDNNACTTADVCSGGSCKGGAAPNCDDGNPCTTDSCDPATGCKKVNNTASCSDGSACTSGDTCAGGTCAPGPAVVCNDNNVCTTDSCDPASGCKYTANTAACDDGNKCTLNDTCAASTCKPGAAKNCSDPDSCTNDTCDPGSGNCAHTPIIGCGGNCATTADCNDSNPCTNDACTGGKCAFTNNTSPCNDSDACTTGDVCSGGKCLGPGSLDCDDGNPCTNDSCDKSNGCQHVNNTLACNDSDACTTGDVCSAGKCAGPTAVNCDDSNVCTADSCDKAQGCLHANTTQTCNDSDACTSGDICAGGVCAGAAIACDDKNDCTVDSCNKATGCVFANAAAGTQCNDSNACTVGDNCQSGVCKPGNLVWVDVLAGQVPSPNSGSGGGALADGTGAAAKFNTPSGLAYMAYDQKIYVADSYNHAIRSVTTDGKVATVAGGAYAGFADGTGAGAQFNLPMGVAAAGKGNLYIVDTNNHALRMLDVGSGSVTTLAGGSEGFNDGSAAKEAQFSKPMGIAVNLAGLVAIADSGNHAIRIYNPSTNMVSTLAGTGVAGSVDTSSGSDTKASFNKPTALAFDGNGTLYVVDTNNHKLRKVTPAGVVSTVAGDGKAGLVDSTNLAAVEFNTPTGIALTSWGPLFVTDGYNGRVRRGGQGGVGTFAGGGASVSPAPALQSSFYMPGGITTDPSGYLYVADSYNHLIRRIRDTGNPCSIGGVCYTNGLISATDSCKSCQGGTSFSARPVGSACNDGLLCTANETCGASGQCTGQAMNCNDGNVCTDDACDALTGGTCTTTFNTATCSDGNPCTVGESCIYGACQAPTGGNACDDKNPCTIDSCTAQSDGTVVCAYAAASSDTICNAPTGTAYGMCRSTVCTGVEQTTIAATGSTSTRLLDINPDKGGGITAVGHAVAAASNAPMGGTYVVNTSSTPPSLAAQWSSTEELWTIRSRLLTGGHATIGGTILDAASYTAVYSGNPPYTSGGPQLTYVSKVLRATGMAIDSQTSNEDYISGGAGDGATLTPPSTLYRFRYLAGSNSWDSSSAKLGEMGVVATTPASSLGCAAAMVNVGVLSVYRPSTTEAFMAVYRPQNSTGYVAYWNAANSLNSLCSGFAPGGTVDLSAGNSKQLTNTGAIVAAVDGSSANNLIAIGTAATSGGPVIWSFNGTSWTGENPNVKIAGVNGSWSNSTFVPQSVAVLEKEAFIGGYVTLSGCRNLFVLHGTRTGNGWAWDHLKVTISTLYNCDSNNAGRLTLSRAWANPKDGAVYFVGSAAATSTGATTVTSGQTGTSQVGLLLRIK